MKTLVKNFLRECGLVDELDINELNNIVSLMEQAQTGQAPKNAVSRRVWEILCRNYNLLALTESGIDPRVKKILMGVTRIGGYHSSEQNMNNCFMGWAWPERYTASGSLRNSEGRTRRTGAPAVATRAQVQESAPATCAPVQTDDERLRSAWEMFRASVAPLMAIQEKNNLPYTFGVEIECGGDVSAIVIRDMFERTGIEVIRTGYDHTDSDRTWKIATDGSLGGFAHTYEVVSPILKGEEGLAELEKVCAVLDGLNVKVNSTCGLHVHIGAQAMTGEQVRNIALNFATAEKALEKCTWKSRTGGRWSHRVSGYRNKLRALDVATLPQAYENEAENVARYIVDNIYAEPNRQHKRYHTLNLATFAHGHKTIEFRQHQGTLDFTKISNWVYMVQALCAWSKDNYLCEPIEEINDMIWADDRLRSYYMVRSIFNATR